MSLLDGIKLFLSPAFLIEKAFTLWTGGGGGGGSQTSTSTSYSTNLPKYAKPYYQELLLQTGKSIFDTVRPDMVGKPEFINPDTGEQYTEKDVGKVTGVKQMPVYGGDRVAGFTQEQQDIQNAIFGMQAPGGFASGQNTLGGAANLATGAGQAGLMKALSYQPGQYNIGAVSGGGQAGGAMDAAQSGYNPNLTTYQMGQSRDVTAPQLRDFLMQGATSGYRPNLTAFQMDQVANISAPQLRDFAMQAATSSYRPDLTAFQMEGPERVAAERAGTETFSPEAARFYMSPYEEEVTDAAVREAKLQANLEKQERAMGSIGRGTFGGARQALIQAERDRGTSQLLSDIRAKGRQSAFESAQKQFEADQARKLQAQQINVQSGLQAMLANQQAQQEAAKQNLQARLGVQQLDTETGRQMALANLTNEQQANVQNLAAKLQTQGLSAENAMRTALANQQTQLQTAQQNLQSRLATQQLETDTGRQMALANLNNEQQARVQNLASQLQTQGLSAEQALKAALANQQNTFQTAQQNLQAALSVQNLGTETGRQMALANLSNQQQANVQNLAAKLQTQGLNAETALKASLANQQTQVQMAQLMEQANQFAAATGKDIGIAGMNQQIEAGKAQVAAAAQEQASQLERLKAQAATAEEKQQLDQQILDLKYNTFMEQENYQRSMLEYYSNILRGNASALGSTQVNYAQPPSMASQIGGLGLAGIGLANAFGRQVIYELT